MTVRPPKTSGELAIIDVSWCGLTASAIEQRIYGPNMADIVHRLSDVELCITWAWLVDSRFA